MNAVAVAKHLNVVESAIVRIEEWANVLFCVVKGIGARFVSKKVVKVKESNQYKGFNGKVYTARVLEIFMHPSLNGREEWHVSGVESDCYCCYQGTPKSDAVLRRAAEKVIRNKYDFIGEIHFSIRPIDPNFRRNGNWKKQELC